MIRKLNPERKEKLFSAALKLFVANGVQHTSTAAIAEEAGVAAGTLFLYFPTKQDLIHELVLKLGEEESEYVKTLLDPSLPVRETFFTIWHGSIRWLLDHLDAYQYIQQVRDSGLVSESVVLESAKFFSFYYDAIQKGFQEGRIKPYSIELIGGFLYQDILATINFLQRQPDADFAEQEETIQSGFDIFWDGIKTGDE